MFLDDFYQKIGAYGSAISYKLDARRALGTAMSFPFVYLSAMDTYRIEREDKVGNEYVDFIFYPEVDKSVDGFILEIKVDSSIDEALNQIKDRRTKKYSCRIGVLKQ